MHKLHSPATDRTERHFQNRGHEDYEPSDKDQAESNLLQLPYDEEQPLDDFYTRTERIKRSGNLTEYLLHDKDLLPLRREAGEEHTGKMFIPEGTKVVRLEPNPDRPTHTRIIVWFDGKYREGYILNAAFEGTDFEDSEHSVEVFINDAERTLNGAINYFDKAKASGLFNNDPDHEAYFKTIIDYVAQRITAHHDQSNIITDDELKAIHAEDLDLEREMGSFPKTDKEPSKYRADVLENVLPNTFGVADPAYADKKYSESVLVVPLSVGWLTRHAKTFYETTWKSNSVINAVFVGGSGDVQTAPADVSSYLNTLRLLYEDIKTNSDALGSSEGQWLASTFSKPTDQIKTIITIHEEAWDVSKNKMYSSDVMIDQSFGMLKTNPIMSLLIHEMNMTDGKKYALDDTHSGPSNTKTAYGKVSDGNLSSLNNNQRELDALFQTHSGIGIIALAAYLKRMEDN